MRPAIPPLDALNRALPTVRTTDAAVARRCLDRVFAQHRLVACGPLNFAHQHVSLGESSISLLRYGSEVDIVAPPLGFYLLQVTLQGRIGLRASGFDVSLEAGSAFVMNPGVGYRKCWDREAQQLMIKIPRRHLESCVSGTANIGAIPKDRIRADGTPGGCIGGAVAAAPQPTRLHGANIRCPVSAIVGGTEKREQCGEGRPERHCSSGRLVSRSHGDRRCAPLCVAG